jgi:Zn-dependent metalloprotease
MKRTAANAVCGLILALACAALAAKPPTASDTSDSFVKQRGITEARFREFYDAEHLSTVHYSEQGSPAYLLGFMAKAYSDSDMVNVAMGFFERNRDVFRLRDPQTELRLASRTIDDRARQLLRFQQLHQGIEVQGGHYTAIFSPGDTLETVTGDFYPDITVPVEPTISSLVAPLLILDKIPGDVMTVTGIDVERVIVPERYGFQPGWRITLRDAQGNETEYVVDAASGAVLSVNGRGSLAE